MDYFELFFQERLWKLASLLVDKSAFNFVNFNSIVKQTLLQRLKQKEETDKELV
jgi:hypothetical protein